MTAVDHFEDTFADAVGRQEIVAFRYARRALQASLMSVPVAQKKVVVPAFTCRVVIDAITLAGGIPVFVDVDPETLEPDWTSGSSTANAAALVFVHYFGWRSRAFDHIAEIAERNGMPVIEDLAHRLVREDPATRRGSFAVYSLSKSLRCPGGGAAAVQDRQSALRLRQLLNEGDLRARPMKERVSEGLELLNVGGRRVANHYLFDRLCSSTPRRVALQARVLASRRVRTSRRRPPVAALRSSSRPTMPSLGMPAFVARAAVREIRNLRDTNEDLRRVGLSIQARVNAEGGSLLRTLAGTDSTYTYVPLFLRQPVAGLMIEAAARRGLLLRPSWSAGQLVDSAQAMRGTAYLADHLVTWQASSGVGDEEANEIANVMIASSREASGRT